MNITILRKKSFYTVVIGLVLSIFIIVVNQQDVAGLSAIVGLPYVFLSLPFLLFFGDHFSTNPFGIITLFLTMFGIGYLVGLAITKKDGRKEAAILYAIIGILIILFFIVVSAFS